MIDLITLRRDDGIQVDRQPQCRGLLGDSLTEEPSAATPTAVTGWP
jgi:hypothetical protein